MVKDFEKLFNEYLEHFSEPFPIMVVHTNSDQELYDVIQKCIDENKPYQPQINEDKIY